MFRRILTIRWLLLLPSSYRKTLAFHRWSVNACIKQQQLRSTVQNLRWLL